MERTQLVFREISQIVGGEGLSVALLTDLSGERAVTIVCDRLMAEQMALRMNPHSSTARLLPEVLVNMLMSDNLTPDDFEMVVYDVLDGQYQVTLLNKQTLTLRSIRMSDAMLLSYISRIPLYIDSQLMARQSTPYTPHASGISIPINTIATERLNDELERAIQAENYRLASMLHEEIQKRRNNLKNSLTQDLNNSLTQDLNNSHV